MNLSQISVISVTLLGSLLSVSSGETRLPDKRVPWKTSRIIGSPNPPPPYRVEPAFAKLRFNNPVEMMAVPGANEWFIAELSGKIFRFVNAGSIQSPELVADLKNDLSPFNRLLGFQFHPKFEQNRHLYICYNTANKTADGSRISRFKVAKTNPPRLDYASEKVIITWRSGGHNGCSIHFGPKDGYLYFSTGDAEAPNPPDTLNTGQDISDLLGGICRIDVDGATGDEPYRVPSDNPFVKTVSARPEVWAYGMRNPWRMSFNRESGELWVGDVGWELWEMIYRVERGGNYGWSIVEGPQPVKPDATRGPTPILKPMVSHSHVEAMSITSGYVYRGKALPDLRGAYLYGDWVSGKIWALRNDGPKVTFHQEIADTPIQIICFARGHDGEVLVVDYQGQIFRLIKNDSMTANRDFPRLLSETGLFGDVAKQIPATGVLPYQIDAAQWLDGATADRFVALPGVAKLGLWTKNEPYKGRYKDNWSFPANGVLARTISIELEKGNPASRRKLETQVLHYDGEEWDAYSYHWNEAQTDAELAGTEGRDAEFVIRDADAVDGRRTLKWRFASRAECFTCHTTKSGYVSGFKPGQLDRDLVGRGNQLAALNQLGLFEKSPVPNPSKAMTDSANVGLESWARRYLDVNCSHCHRRGGGGTATIDVREELALDKTDLIDTPPTQGDFEITNARIIAPGDPSRSILLYRMAKTGSGRMPHIGSHDVDADAVQRMSRWIRGMDDSVAVAGTGKGESRWRNPESALMAAVDLSVRPKAANGWSNDDVAKVLQSPPNIRDLFERFLPESKRRKTLGAALNPTSILALKSDWRRGQELFFQQGGAQCARCHRVQNLGREVGPDLNQIGRKYNRAQLLEQILKPSAIIDPNFVSVDVETKDGESITGYVVNQSAGGYTIRDAAGKDHALKNGQISSRRPSKLSLMPEGLLQAYTAQEAADLLAYLESLR